ncbi:MAG: energy-coupling factor ABC transporter ATP-binding protein [Conexivisphaera sp.]
MRPIELEHVWYLYPGGKRALEDVSLSVEAGEVVALVGRNGSGKTTLLKHLNGLLKPTRGSVRIFGVDTRRARVGQLSRHVGLVFQSPRAQLFAPSVLEEAMFGPRNFRVEDPRGAAERALREVGLAGLEGRPPLSLSGGEQRRLTLAAVLGWGPRVIALDEPTVGQDLRNKMRLLGLVRLWSSRGMTVIMASHDVEFLWLLGPRVVAMADGRVVADGPARRVLSDESVARAAGFELPQLADLGRLIGRDLSDAAEAAREIAGMILR